jgi:hypothetical protein
MMKKILNISLLIFLFIALNACKKDEIMIFDVNDSGVVLPGLGDANVYKGYNSEDKTYYVNESFLNVPLTQDKYIVDFPVKVSGDSLSKDRVIAYQIDPALTTALTTQYRIIDAVIPAGKLYGRIRFELTRDVALNNSSVKVAFKLAESPDLKVGSNEYCKGVLTWSNMLAMFPSSSSYVRTYNCIILSPLTKTSNPS